MLSTVQMAMADEVVSSGENAAQSAQASAYEPDADIMVTARRRSERAQEVPIALSVVSAEKLAQTGAYTLSQIQQLAPSLQIISSNPRNTNINIRGLGSNVAFTNDGLENGVGVYIDNVYYSRFGQSQFDLVDLERVEVLRGPQGTLFGKNTTAGAINITSRAPSFEPEFRGELSVGNFGYHQIRGSGSAGLSDWAALRLSVSDTHRDGYIHNVLTGKDVQSYDNFALRSQLLLKPSGDVDVRLIGDFGRQSTRCCVNQVASVFATYDSGAPIPNNYYDRNARAGYIPPSVDPFARLTDYNGRYEVEMESYGVSGQVDWNLGASTLTSITAYRWWDWNPQNDSDNTALDSLRTVAMTNRQRQFSQELRFASEGDNNLDYVAGLYYFWQRNTGHNTMEYGADAAAMMLPAAVPQAIGNLALDGFRTEAFSDPSTKSYAAFGQLTWTATDKLKVTAGLRYTHEEKSGSYRQIHSNGDVDLIGLPAQAAGTALALRTQFAPLTDYGIDFSEGAVSGLLTASYAPGADRLIYATYSRGAKSGGLNLSVLPAGVEGRVKAETVDAFELGLKSQWFDRTLTVNLAAFQSNVRDYQTVVFDAPPGSLITYQYVGTIPKVRSRGLEADVSWQPSQWLSFSASGTYLDPKYLDYANAVQAPENADQGPSQDLTGHRLAGSSKYSYSLSADASQPLGVGEWIGYAHADFAYRSSFFTTISNSRYSLVDGYGLLNGRVGIRSDDRRWDLSVWARNLTDKQYFQTLNVGNAGSSTGIIGEPRTYGLTLRNVL